MINPRTAVRGVTNSIAITPRAQASKAENRRCAKATRPGSSQGGSASRFRMETRLSSRSRSGIGTNGLSRMLLGRSPASKGRRPHGNGISKIGLARARKNVPNFGARAIELRYNQIWRSADRLSSSTVSACLLGLLKRARAIVRRWSSNVPEH